MATKFKVWIDSPSAGTNVQDATTFASDGQRTSGFTLGTSASSIRVNSAIRQANLVAVALMEAILPNSELDLTSSVSSLSSEISSYFTGQFTPINTAINNRLVKASAGATGTHVVTVSGATGETTTSTRALASTIANDSTIPYNSAVYTQMDGKKIKCLSESAYEALETKDANTLYQIYED